jgi:hypothetical protein
MLCCNYVGCVIYFRCYCGCAGNTDYNAIAYRKPGCTLFIKDIATSKRQCGRVYRSGDENWTGTGGACCCRQNSRSSFSIRLRIRKQSLLG